MDRKSIAGVVLALVVLVAWEFYYAKTVSTQKAAAAAQAKLSGTTAALTGTAPAPALTTAAEATPAPTPTAPAVAETTLKASVPSVEYTFTNLGGGISKVVLKKFQAEKGALVTLNEYGTTPIGALATHPGEDGRDAYTVFQQGGQVVCTRTTPDNLQIVKTFTLPTADDGKDQYLAKLDIAVTNRGHAPVQSDGYYINLGSAAFIHQGDRSTYTGFDWFHGDASKFIDVNWFSSRSIPIVGIQTTAEQTAYSDAADAITWAGVTNQYFATILSSTANPGAKVWARRFLIPAPKPLYGIEGALGSVAAKLAPGQSHTESYELYTGPKEYHLLRDLGNSEEEIMHFNWTKYVSLFLLASMNWLKGIFGNYVAAILVLTICIKSVLWIPQNAATKSMKKMQALQPKMTELREKYKDDPSRMNQELMKLYKDYGINPFAGCLPMFIQIPIFFGFFNMLGSAVELRGSGFLWVKDLSQPDTIATIAGYHINLLPLLMAVTMLWQMSITPKTGDPVQQRVMMFVPLIFVFFCYNFASALSLYYSVQNLFSIAQLYVTRNQQIPALQKISAAAAQKKNRLNRRPGS